MLSDFLAYLSPLPLRGRYNSYSKCVHTDNLGKNKLYLLDQGVIGVLKSIFENHFQRRGLDLVHSEIALIAVAVIRHLSKTRESLMRNSFK